MATFKITADKSRYETDFLEAAFGFNAADDTAGADSLIVDASAFLVSTNLGGIGAFLAATKAWTVTVNGSVVSQQHSGIELTFGASTMSTITVGSGGSISGVDGINALNGVNIKNSGVIFGTDTAITLNGAEAHTITNAKGATIQCAGVAILDETGLSNDKVINAGFIDGDIDLAGGNDSFTNTENLNAVAVDLGEGDDTLTNSGALGSVALGNGNNVFTNSGKIMLISIGTGNDKFANSGEISGNVDLGTGNNTLINSGSIDGYVGAGSGNDIITNSGLITGAGAPPSSVILGNGNNKFVNSGVVNGMSGVDSGIGDDVVTNTGKIEGTVNLGNGKNTLTNSGKGLIGSTVTLGAQDDVVTNSGTIVGVVFFGEGNNKLTNSGMIANVHFGDGNNIIINSGTITDLLLGDGNDQYTGGAKVDVVADSGGSDVVKLGGGNDTYHATTFFGIDGSDTIDAGTGIDVYTVELNNSPIQVNLDSKDQALFSFGTIAKSSASGAATGVDKISGFEDVTGSDDADLIYGNAGVNVLEGVDGNDVLGGFAGNDTLSGGADADTLIGGAGRDLLFGGSGNDEFIFSNKDSGVTKATRDLIDDFATGDKIRLTTIDANTKNGPGDDAFVFIGTHETFDGVAGQLRAYWTATGQIIEGDVNGDKKADFSIEIRDEDHSIVLTSGDFFL